jgi:hypothetical protein
LGKRGVSPLNSDLLRTMTIMMIDLTPLPPPPRLHLPERGRRPLARTQLKEREKERERERERERKREMNESG